MRMLTFSFLKKFKKKIWYQNSRNSVGDAVQVQDNSVKIPAADPNLIEIDPSWKEDEEQELRAAVLRDMRVYPEFVTEAEEAALLEELEPYLKRMRYEFDHWDNAIQGYRETERGEWGAAGAGALRRVREAAFAAAAHVLPRVHVLDLAAAGHVRPHVDAVRFCGDTIAGLCLLSAAVMRLQATRDARLRLDALLPRRALYVMRGCARYEFSHAVLGGAESRWRGQPLRRQRRLALITRSAPDPARS